MDQDFSELIGYLDEKFQEIDGRFEQIDERFQKLFEVFATKEDLREIAEKLATKENFNTLFTSVDTYAKRADTYF